MMDYLSIFSYQKKYPTGTPSPSYVCFKCNKTGHFIHNCPNAAAVSTVSIYNIIYF